MTTLDHLRTLTNVTPRGRDHCCGYCWGEDGHTTNCPWLAAKRFVEEQDQQPTAFRSLGFIDVPLTPPQ